MQIPGRIPNPLNCSFRLESVFLQSLELGLRSQHQEPLALGPATSSCYVCDSSWMSSYLILGSSKGCSINV